jgi:hypothetical protein
MDTFRNELHCLARWIASRGYLDDPSLLRFVIGPVEDHQAAASLLRELDWSGALRANNYRAVARSATRVMVRLLKQSGSTEAHRLVRGFQARRKSRAAFDSISLALGLCESLFRLASRGRDASNTESSAVAFGLLRPNEITRFWVEPGVIRIRINDGEVQTILCVQ